MVRHRGPVLVDTNAILECWRVGAWRGLTSGYVVETVEDCDPPDPPGKILGKPLFPPQIPAGPVELVGAKYIFADVRQFAAIELGSSKLVVFGHTHEFGAHGWVRHFSCLPCTSTGQFHQIVIGLHGISRFTCRLLCF